MTGGADHLRTALADRYTIERELGRGGNAVVYLAHDRKHDRKVAVKVLPPEVALAVRSERFLREIQIAAKLTHPHILPIHDSGAVDGLLYYVMPYVTGESLRDRLRREKQLPVEEALRFTREIAEVLSYAHRQGVVHRDIKPENVLLQEGHAVVADFGIASALTVAGGAGVTEAGLAVGTPAYMSPEQASGANDLDGRSDIYSLGCVCYEMLAGRPPFNGATAQEIFARHALDPIPSVRAACPEVPERMEAALRRALAKTPVNRLATAADFAAALAGPTGRRPLSPRRRLLYASLALVVLAGSALAANAWFGRSPGQSVAVLPFVNLGGDTTNEYLGDGIAEELINALVQVEGLRVPARTSAFAFKSANPNIREVGRSLNVAHVLEGSVRREGDSVRVTAQLIKVTDGYHVWSATYDRELRGVLTLQADIARAIVQALEVRLRGGDSAVMARRVTGNPQAYDHYLRGRYFLDQRRPGGVLKAIDNFGRAIELDSGFAAAYSGLADGYLAAARERLQPREQSFEHAKSAALRAIALDESLAEAHTSLGRVYQVHDWDLRAADGEFRRAIALNPRYPLARAFYATFLARGLGRPDEAIRHATLAHELDPLSPSIHSIISGAMRAARRYDDAIVYARRAIDLSPDWSAPHNSLGDSYRLKGMYQEALTEYATAARLGGRDQFGGLADVYVQTGRRAEAVAIRERLEKQSRFNGRWVQLARVYVALSENDLAIQALDSALTMHDFTDEPTLAGNPDWDSLRSDPRFARLLQRLDLPR